MNYIGSKNRLSSFIEDTITNVAGTLVEKTLADLFAGTGIVGRLFKNSVKSIIANDIEYYSFTLNRNYIGNITSLNYVTLLEELNALDGEEGFIYQNYCWGSGSERLYFSDENGKKIDAIRITIEKWRKEKHINEDMYFFLLTSLLEAADKVANTASVYGAFLKKLKKTALADMVLVPALFEETPNAQHQVFNEDGNVLIHQIEGDILYLDPPYNARQYGANYHMLNTIARYDIFEPVGKTGLRPDYQRSQYCKKGEVKAAFEELIKSAQFQYIFLSYNNEGLMSVEDVREIMEKYGKYDLAEQAYQRFKADQDENRNFKADQTFEYLHILEKNG